MPNRLLMSLALAASSCCVATVAADGDRQVVTWNRWPASPRACALVPGELLEDSQLTNNTDAGVGLAKTGQTIARDKMRENELRAYRLCEAYANGAISEEEYRNGLLNDSDSPTASEAAGAR